MIKSTLLLIVGTVAAFVPAQLAFAQAPPQRPIPITSWSCPYVGLQLGGSFGQNPVTTAGQATANVNNVNGGARPANTQVGRSGVFGGAQAGYGHQFHRVYLGAETDLAGARLSGQRVVTTTALTGGGILTNTFDSNLRYIGTARGNLGHVFGRVLVYGTGGFAYGLTDQQANFTGAAPANTLQFTGRRNQIEKGYTVGGGAEYRASRHFSYKAEYLYFRLQDETRNVAGIAGSGGGGTGYDSRFQNKGNMLRLGANFRF